MKFISAYLLAATVVETGSYDEEYEVYDDPEFAEEMEEWGSEAVGEYIELKPPNDGEGSFSGDQFCEDWLAAFVRPFEYMQIVEAKAQKTGTWYPSTDDDSDWISSPPAMANGFYTNENNVIKLIPEYLDEELEGMSLHKHVNLWFVSVSYFNNNIQTSRYFKVYGGYVASGGFRCTGNYPTQGFMSCSLENTGGASWNFSQYAISHQVDAYQRWLGGSGTYNKGNFILVYNVDAFKDYLERLDFNNAINLASNYFLLAECNIKKEKDPSTSTTDWSDNDDYHGE